MDINELKNKYALSELEISSQDISSHSISFIANKLKQAQSENLSGKAVRIFKNNKMGFSSALGENNVEDIIKRALDVLQFYPEVNFKLPQNTHISDIKNSIDSDILNFCRRKGEEVIDLVLSKTNDSSILVDVSFDVTNFTDSLENSNNLKYFQKDSSYSFSLNIRKTTENDFIEISSGITDNSFPDINDLVGEVISNYKLSRKHSKVKNGPIPVLFTSKAAKELIDIVESALDGKQVIEKSTPWHDKYNKKVLSSLITIRQNPHFGHMARSLDDEGIVIQDLVLIEKGVIKNFYFDLSTASKTKEYKSTGNGFKTGLSSLPEPSLLNMVVSPGEKSLEEIIRGINYGLLVDQTMGGLTGNISGDLAINVDLGFLIEKGEIVGRVKDTMLKGNIYTALNNIIELSNKPKWYWSGIYNPDILVDGFTVSSKQ